MNQSIGIGSFKRINSIIDQNAKKKKIIKGILKKKNFQWSIFEHEVILLSSIEIYNHGFFENNRQSPTPNLSSKYNQQNI